MKKKGIPIYLLGLNKKGAAFEEFIIETTRNIYGRVYKGNMAIEIQILDYPDGIDDEELQAVAKEMRRQYLEILK